MLEEWSSKRFKNDCECTKKNQANNDYEQNKYKISLLKEIMNGWNNYFKESFLLFHFSDLRNHEPKKFTK